jgi:acyl dehydratase
VVHAPLTPDTRLRCETRVTEIEDKGPGKGALVHWRRELSDAESASPVATLDSTLFCRKDGGFGGTRRPKQEAAVWPDAAPTAVVEKEISPRAALIYRLSGDFNPIHADPKLAVEAGFDQPILHGLCTFAMATWSVISELAYSDVSALESVQVRFKAPVVPGQRLRTEMWQDGAEVRFRAYTGDRMVLDGGSIRLRGEQVAA